MLYTQTYIVYHGRFYIVVANVVVVENDATKTTVHISHSLIHIDCCNRPTIANVRNVEWGEKEKD